MENYYTTTYETETNMLLDKCPSNIILELVTDSFWENDMIDEMVFNISSLELDGDITPQSFYALDSLCKSLFKNDYSISTHDYKLTIKRDS